MKILFLSSHAHLVLEKSTTRVSGGAELQIALLARELMGRGIETVIAGGDTGQRDGVVHDGVKIRNGGKFQTGGLVDTVRALPRVYQILREERPDWVFLLGWTTWLWFVLQMRRALGFRLGFICGLDSEVNGEFRRENPVRGAAFEAAMRRCDIRFAMTGDQRRLFEANGMTCAFYRNLVLPREKPLTLEKTTDFLWVSRCQRVKRPQVFLDLVERLPGASFRMVCPREDVDLWESVQARAKGLANLDFVERVPYHEVQAVYDAAKVFVNTSEWEGWPNSFIQAGLGGTALLSLAVNPDRLFETFFPGRFVGGSFEMLVSAAQEMIREESALSGFQAGAARFVREMHDNQRETEAFLSGLREAAPAT